MIGLPLIKYNQVYAHSNRLVGHKIRSKDCKKETSFIQNGGVTVQGEVCKDNRTEWSLSPAIELPALQYNLLYAPLGEEGFLLNETILLSETFWPLGILKLFDLRFNMIYHIT